MAQRSVVRRSVQVDVELDYVICIAVVVMRVLSEMDC